MRFIAQAARYFSRCFCCLDQESSVASFGSNLQFLFSCRVLVAKAMQKLKHFSHECELASPKTVADSVCNICYKDEPVEFACKSCNFDLCKSCSKLPEKVYHDFHPEHPLELCLLKYDRKPKYVVCSGCGNMYSGSFYKCRTCEIYLDLCCALHENIIDAWDVEELLHDSHCHLLRRCRPGSDAKGSCLLCELPVSPSSICYGCVHCYSFVHHKCIDLPTEIQHPVHPAHPLRRLSYLRTCYSLIFCSACRLAISGVPYSCRRCDINLHLRCADSLLRGLMHKSHKHRLFFVPARVYIAFDRRRPCQICMKTKACFVDSYYHRVECDLKFHFECLGIPKSLIKKSFHTHPLVCKIFLCKDESLEYCGVCETMVHAGHHVYSCEECDFLGHIECILREEEPSPLYLKDLYIRGEDVTRATNQGDGETNILETKLMVNGTGHVHVMRPIHMGELDEKADCNICREKILGSPCKCTSCSFQTHHLCAELGQPSNNRLLHWDHSLTLLPKSPTQESMHCNSCRSSIWGFNLFCRICNFIIDIKCALRGKHSLGMLGKKVIGEWRGHFCINNGRHEIVQVIISRSYMTDCAICFEKLHGKALSCMTCGEIYHSRCIELWRRPLFDHPLHSNHVLAMKVTSGPNCIACKMNIPKHGYCCDNCNISFHIECIKAVDMSTKIKSHIHYLYNFWMEDLRLTQACSVCARPCGVSFYGCVDCNFNAHVECVGIATNVKSQQHQHSVVQNYISDKKSCSLCGSECSDHIYRCKHCDDVFHIECLMPKDDRKAATEEEQLCDIYLMYLERNLLDLLKSSES